MSVYLKTLMLTHRYVRDDHFLKGGKYGKG